MSRKGKAPIPLIKGIEVKLEDSTLTVKGPKGTLTREIISGIELVIENDHLQVNLASGYEKMSNYHGLYRSLINNMVVGLSQGFTKKLEMIGVGYRAVVQGQLLDLQVGYSHPTKLTIPEGLQVAVEKNTTIVISGSDPQQIGQFAAQVRAIRPPEPYQGKGIRYAGEYVRKKAGKSASAKK
ncbi:MULTISPECIES: 50S ribosomal protein L6 [unclassified Neochlamydia]|uniref:50S ribosomal protein L6 n=1 Tax=unclassified Neochlamydia TaxID=2643326 RepID=UPI0014092CD7|nr:MULTISPECIES: 50S ribosomal protein L6 [unclassified Neochlamydia]MBS4165553.1 50S ribosomal protein L6 [Neochlamydia sp. AcF65]MBS4169609.1 50S ribosomal protein L6 [Neochlamydia sp. AcF95]NGY94434.1 50S ribosomal protein L6 [Neochlamydia sp. AcF84]